MSTIIRRNSIHVWINKMMDDGGSSVSSMSTAFANSSSFYSACTNDSDYSGVTADDETTDCCSSSEFSFDLNLLVDDSDDDDDSEDEDASASLKGLLGQPSAADNKETPDQQQTPAQDNDKKNPRKSSTAVDMRWEDSNSNSNLLNLSPDEGLHTKTPLRRQWSSSKSLLKMAGSAKKQAQRRITKLCRPRMPRRQLSNASSKLLRSVKHKHTNAEGSNESDQVSASSQGANDNQTSNQHELLEPTTTTEAEEESAQEEVIQCQTPTQDKATKKTMRGCCNNDYSSPIMSSNRKHYSKSIMPVMAVSSDNATAQFSERLRRFPVGVPSPKTTATAAGDHCRKLPTRGAGQRIQRLVRSVQPSLSLSSSKSSGVTSSIGKLAASGATSGATATSTIVRPSSLACRRRRTMRSAPTLQG